MAIGCWLLASRPVPGPGFPPGAAPPVRYALEDVDGDTDWDLILHFDTQETGIGCDDTEATLTGQTLGGVPIAGTDSINTVGCNK